MVSWYTKGGMVDACGNTRRSGFFFKWAALSVLNDDPPLDTISHVDEYITCFDAITKAVHEVDPNLKTMGPEQWPSPSNLDYYKYFMNGSNHKDGKPPQLISAHHVSHHEDRCEYSHIHRPSIHNVQQTLTYYALDVQMNGGSHRLTRGWQVPAGRLKPIVRRLRPKLKCT